MLSSKAHLGHTVYLDCLESQVYLALKETVGSRAPLGCADYPDCLALKAMPDIRENRDITESRGCRDSPARRARRECAVWQEWLEWKVRKAIQVWRDRRVYLVCLESRDWSEREWVAAAETQKRFRCCCCWCCTCRWCLIFCCSVFKRDVRKG